jgi:hypothetical protein
MLAVTRPRLLATVNQLQARAGVLIGAVDTTPTTGGRAQRTASLPGRLMGALAWRGAR